MAQWALYVCACQFIRAAAAIMSPEIGLWMHISLSPLELRVSSASRERTNKVTMTNIDGALSLLPNRFMATCICPLKNYRFRPIHHFFCFCSTAHVPLLICVVSSGNPGWSNTYPMSNVDNYAIFGWASLLGVMAVVCCGGFDVLLPRKGLNGPNPQFVLPEFRGLITLAAKTVHI